MTLGIDTSGIGKKIFDLAAEIFPICRSITGTGVRETLGILGRHIPLEMREVPTGTKVFDWTVPKEWNIRDAYIKDTSGRRIVDFNDSNLHVVSYSRPLRATLPLSELRKHIHVLPDQPSLIPYRTSYYSETWGFCMADDQLRSLPDGNYEVLIDATLDDGHLSYGECVLQGESAEEILLSAHVCHPSLADDNCSGLAVLTMLAAALKDMPTHYTYRFLFAPGTIGAITWLALNENRASNIKGGLVVSCLGDGGGPTYKKSRRGDHYIDKVMTHVLEHFSPTGTVIEFSPYGYDERQYCSPGFNLPVGLLQRSQFGKFPEYHTSADNLDFIKPEHLDASFRILINAIEIIEHDRRYVNLFPKCEPQLGRRGLYNAIGGDKDAPSKNMAMLWLLNLSDGQHSLLDIANRAKIPFTMIRNTADLLVRGGLLE